MKDNPSATEAGRPTREALETTARELRKAIVRMHRRGTCVGSAMSAAEIVSVLYFDVMKLDDPHDPDRDRFILSKGHAASVLYAALARKGFLHEGTLSEYLTDGSCLAGHPCRGELPGVEASTGSLGHGLPIAVGVSWAAKIDKRGYMTYVLMGDGECQEGSVWEGAMVADRLRLDNLVAIIDGNRIQGYGRVDDIQPVSTLGPKFEAFGWGVTEVDGHDVTALREALDSVPIREGAPTAIVAHTVKGKGVAEMEDDLGWHYYSVPEEKVEPFLRELDGKE